MTLDDITDGSRVLIDTNLLLYASAGKSPQCASLVRRCAQGAVFGVVTTVVLGELCHRWMMEEALHKGFVCGGNPARQLAKDKAVISQLSSYADLVNGVVHGALDIAPVEAGDFPVALSLQRQWSLMTNDSLLLAVGQRLGIDQVATADTDFDRLRGWLIYKPDDCSPALAAP